MMGHANEATFTPRPFDRRGFVLFGLGVGLLSWVLEIFGDHDLGMASMLALLGLSLIFLTAYGWHTTRVSFPLLRLSLFRTRTFSVGVLGSFATRLAVGGMPFLLPLLYQVGMGLPAWQAGLLMMPTAAAAMGMKMISTSLLRRFGFRQVLVVNTVLIAATIAAYASVGRGTPLTVIVLLGLLLGLFNSLQFSSVNSMAYADIDKPDAATASPIATTFQQLSMSFGLAGSLLLAGSTWPALHKATRWP